MGNKLNHMAKVTVSCGTKFHSDYTAFQLDKNELLAKVVTSHPSSRYLNRVNLRKDMVDFLPPIFAPSVFLAKFFGNGNYLSTWLDFHIPLLFDLLATFRLKKSEILLTWAWSGLKSIKTVKAKGGIVLVEECGSCTKYQNRLLKEEYAALGITFNSPTPEFIVDRQLEEAKLADYLLCPSKHVINSFVENGIPIDKCVLIPYGVNLDLFRPQFKIKEKFTVICVGTIGIRKGHIYLLQALEILKSKISINCILIGKIEPVFQECFDRYKHLVFHYPHIDHKDIADYYNKASLFVLPSLDEGMALVQLEAMACGLPIICTQNSGGDSVITDGEEGFIVPIKDSFAIAEKIMSLYHDVDQLKSLSTKAQMKAKEFTWDRYGNILSNFIRSL